MNNRNEENDNNRGNRQQENRYDNKQKDYNGENDRNYRNNHDKINHHQHDRNQQKNEDLRFKLQQNQQKVALSYDKQQKNQIMRSNDEENDIIDLTKTLSFSNSKYKKEIRQNNDEEQPQNKYNNQQKPQIPLTKEPFINKSVNSDDRFNINEKNQNFSQITEPQFQIQNNRMHYQNNFNNNNTNMSPFNIPNQFHEYINSKYFK